jgi:HlyD family secretion protein
MTRGSQSTSTTQYKFAKVTQGDVEKTISATGTLQPWSTVDIKSKAGGRVNSLLVDVGSVVANNQILARIDPSDTQLAVDTAQANINGALARTRQSVDSYQLQVEQDRIAVTSAQSALAAAVAARDNATAKLHQAGIESAAQPDVTSASIAQAAAGVDQALKQRAALDSTNTQDLASAQAAYDQAVANTVNSKAALTRQKSLLELGYVAQQTVDAAQASYAVNVSQTESAKARLSTIAAQHQSNAAALDAAVAQARASLRSAQASGVVVGSKQSGVVQAKAALAQAAAQVKTAQAALNEARANLANDQIKKEDIAVSQASVSANQASLVNAQTTLTQTVVRSPAAGVILVKDVSEGTIITSGISANTTGTTLLTLGDISRMYVNVTVDETDIASVKPGQDVEVEFDAFPDKPFAGVVTRIDPQAVVVSNVTSFNVRIEIDNKTKSFKLLRPGMSATCNFLIEVKRGVVSVPAQAVQTDDKGTYVLVAASGQPSGDAASKVSRRNVVIGLEGDDSVEIVSGLLTGDSVVTQTILPTPATAPAGKSAIGGGMPGPGGSGSRRSGK